jgi:YD repeat-containing protein
LWSAFLGLTQDAGPNGATMNVWYDSFGRPTQAKSRHDAYNGDGLVQYKTGAKNQTAPYDYDSYRRLKEVKRFPSPGCRT